MKDNKTIKFYIICKNFNMGKQWENMEFFDLTEQYSYNKTWEIINVDAINCLSM